MVRLYIHGDNRTGAGDGDDEQTNIDLNNVPASVQRITFTITIHDAESRSQNFGQVSNAYVRILNGDSNQELIRYDLGEDFSIETALVVGELYRHNGEWKFSAIGSGFQGGLASLSNKLWFTSRLMLRKRPANSGSFLIESFLRRNISNVTSVYS